MKEKKKERERENKNGREGTNRGISFTSGGKECVRVGLPSLGNYSRFKRGWNRRRNFTFCGRKSITSSYVMPTASLREREWLLVYTVLYLKRLAGDVPRSDRL